ncbi:MULTISPECIES: undecaprenyl diphosphate synthase family protein [unclassified Methanoregula]|uniref:undecaprenyl diphosphate synthase family protein n=1 Tax=unclassified Methanoregula TaxID=2649730 RepID=UPI0009C94F12|nr:MULTISPECIES: undecaprenyl diphosphate synthase family protein [unclassified Methanoregula]OPX64945.1 MAG: Tritrans,polycis-undecaprenyl-diphosphate synthase (GGDP specific) [Methanoregula sp. PtaB.Bin085]OPY32997.1 MAG: Tritrans,polycis-undecaprenyl-diphosphate synthase (GGDP specific) [Methanoregula sp. PtaU1.Bin006]
MLYWLYARLLKRQITVLPGQVCFMIGAKDMADAPDHLYRVTSWCNEISSSVAKRTPPGSAGIRGLTFHIATPEPCDPERFLPAIRRIGTIARLSLHYGDRKEVTGTGMDVVVAIGKSGREEITECIRRMARDHVPPENVDEQLLDSYLTFRYTPDIVIKSGGDHLTDFLIWQSVYSELFFSDVNWKFFRSVDFLRILRDYQSRIRRFGK